MKPPGVCPGARCAVIPGKTRARTHERRPAIQLLHVEFRHPFRKPRRQLLSRRLVSGQVQGGSVKAFAVATPDRSPVIPNVPTAREAGMPEFAAETWTGLYVPKGLPAHVLAKLRDTVSRSIADPATQERFSRSERPFQCRSGKAEKRC